MVSWWFALALTVPPAAEASTKPSSSASPADASVMAPLPVPARFSVAIRLLASR